MNEAEWLECDDPVAMIEFLRGHPVGTDEVSWFNNRHQWHDPPLGRDRRFRLFGCQCCRRIWSQIPEECNRAAVIAVEELLEGIISPEEAYEAFIASSAVEWKEDGSGRRTEPGYWVVKVLGRGFYKMTAGASALIIAARTIGMMTGEYGREAAREFQSCYYSGEGVFLRSFEWPVPIPAAAQAERELQVGWLRDLFGYPSHAVTFSPEWRTNTVVGLALHMYHSRDFTAMPILADALQAGGCSNPDILLHCRESTPHIRGCWVVDLVLGNE